MIRDLLILPNGRELFSGANETVTIKSLCYTQQVSGRNELDFCCAAAAGITVQLLDETGSFTIAPDTALQYYRVDEGGERLLMGTFYAQKATRPGKYIVEFQAYDAMILAEQDLSDWLLIQSWPMTMQVLLTKVCQQCGIPTQSWKLCNGSQRVYQFWQQVTGRQLISWVAEANGVFAGITPEGTLAMKTLTTAATPLTPRDLKNCQCAERSCVPINRIAIHQQEGDVGVVWPNAGDQTYSITANPLLPNYSESMLLSCAQRLYSSIKNISYTPMEAEAFVDALQLPWQPGELVQVQMGDKTRTCAVFSIRLEGNVVQLKSWGQPYRDSAAGRHSRDAVKILQKQMTTVSVDVEGISTEVARMETEFEDRQALMREDITALQVASDKISAQVTQVETAAQIASDLTMTEIELLKKQAQLAVTPEQMELSISTALDDGVQKVVTKTGYVFDEQGLSIATSRSDIGNLLDHTGMRVSRGDEVILRADADGVSARDVTVGNYLVVGSHARLEDYNTGRTACFWL